MEPCKIRGTTQPLVSRTGAGRQENLLSFQSREKNVLDIPSYRSGDSTQNPAPKGFGKGAQKGQLRFAFQWSGRIDVIVRNLYPKLAK